jgi:hypothetical protein
MKHGIGTYYWSDGSKYEGEWKENNLHGYGFYNFTDNRSYIGQWRNNVMHGYGEFNWKDGKKYVGYYINDKKEGFGIYHWQVHNKAYIGFWRDGKQDGVGKYITPTKTRFGLWKGGERTKWFANEEEAFKFIKVNEMKYKELLKYDLKEIDNYLNDII